MKIKEYLTKGIEEGIIKAEDVDLYQYDMEHCKVEELEAYCSEIKEELQIREKQVQELNYMIEELRRRLSKKKKLKRRRKMRGIMAAVFMEE